MNSENNRLFKDKYHTLEYDMTFNHLEKKLPPKGRILDIGGGSGFYALELYRRGYNVTLLDISQDLIDCAKNKYEKIKNKGHSNEISFVCADIRKEKLFNSNSFDAILCLGGVLSIIDSDDERNKVINTIVNLTKSQGIVFISVLGFIALLRTLFSKYPDKFLDEDLLKILLENNKCTVGDKNEIWKFFRAQEFKEYLESYNIKIEDVIGCESLSSGLWSQTNSAIENKIWGKWLFLINYFCNDSTVVDISEHILYIGRINKQKLLNES